MSEQHLFELVFLCFGIKSDIFEMYTAYGAMLVAVRVSSVRTASAIGPLDAIGVLLHN